jgi:hypothetical protein
MTTTTGTATQTRVAGRIGDSPLRPDGTLKVTGEFAYSSDLWHEDMCWGVTLRSPHPHARIRSIDTTAALAVPGVHAVLTHTDVPGTNRVGLEHLDQPVLAEDVVRHQGEAVALVAADHPETARRAAKRIAVDYEVLPAVTDPRRALDEGVPAVQPGGNLVREVRVRRGDPSPTAPVVVGIDVEVGMQDQAFLGPESGLAVPDDEGGLDLYVATQWLHVDQQQVCRALGLPPERARLHLAGVGGRVRRARGPVGARARLPARAAHRQAGEDELHPRGVVLRARAPAPGVAALRVRRAAGRHGSSTAGPTSCSTAARTPPPPARWSATAARWAGPVPVPERARRRARGVHAQPAVRRDARVRLRAGRVRARGADGRPRRPRGRRPRRDPRAQRHARGRREHHRSVIDSAAPVAELVEIVRDLPLPPPRTGDDLRDLPGGVSNTTHGEGVVRGIGYAVTYKNVGFSEGFDDYSTAAVRLEITGGEPVATVHTAAAEVGQGLITWSSRSAAPSWASSAWSCTPRTPPSAPAGPPRRRGRPTSPAGR